MLVTAVDPDLLLYERDQWEGQIEGSLNRMQAFVKHRDRMRRGHGKLLMSQSFAAYIMKHFPWDSKDMRLQDLRQFVIDDLNRTELLPDPANVVQCALSPEHVTCAFSSTSDTRAVWLDLLVVAVQQRDRRGWDIQVATWLEPVERTRTTSLTLGFTEDKNSTEYQMPLVWNEERWNQLLAGQDAWPDLQLCVERYHEHWLKEQQAMRAEPLRLVYSDELLKSVERQPDVRQAFVKSVSKLVYGIKDKGLGDEQFQGRRRFRVTGFWRVNYRQEGDTIFLEDFGEHDIGIK